MSDNRRKLYEDLKARGLDIHSLVGRMVMEVWDEQQETDEAKERPPANADLVSIIQPIMQKALNGGHTAKECEMLKKYFGEILSKHRPAPAAQGHGESLREAMELMGDLMATLELHDPNNTLLEKADSMPTKFYSRHPIPSTEGKVVCDHDSIPHDNKNYCEKCGQAWCPSYKPQQPRPDSEMAKELRALIKRRKEAGQAVCCDIWATEINTILDHFDKQEA